MTGTPKTKPPKNNAEWARGVDKRVNSVEHPTSSRVGQWVLSTDDSGNLLASFANGGSVVLARVPADEENDPDAVSVNAPMIKLNRAEPQDVAGGAANVRVLWDSLVENRGQWGADVVPVQIISVPVTGTYLIIYRLAEVAPGYYFLKGTVYVNGSKIMTGEVNHYSSINGPVDAHYRTLYMADVVRLQAGANIECGVGALTNTNIGANNAEPQNATSLTIICLDKE